MRAEEREPTQYLRESVGSLIALNMAFVWFCRVPPLVLVALFVEEVALIKSLFRVGEDQAIKAVIFGGEAVGFSGFFWFFFKTCIMFWAVSFHHYPYSLILGAGGLAFRFVAWFYIIRWVG